MTTFDEREKSFEKKFAMDEELKFKAERAAQQAARRNGRRASSGSSGTEVDDYVKAVRKADLAPRATRTCSRRSRRTSTDKGVAVADAELRKAMDDFLAQAMQPDRGREQGRELRSRVGLKRGRPMRRASIEAGRATWPERRSIDLTRAPHYLLATNASRPPQVASGARGDDAMARKSRTAQRANIASVDPIWAGAAPRGRGGRAQRAGARRLHLCDHPEQGPARGRRVPSPGAAAQPLRRRCRADRRDVRAGAGRSPRARPRLPRRPRRRLRPRSRLQPLHRAAALLQGLPRARHAPLRARAAASRAGATSRSTCRARARASSPSTSIRRPRSASASCSTTAPASSSARRRRSATTARCCRA